MTNSPVVYFVDFPESIPQFLLTSH